MNTATCLDNAGYEDRFELGVAYPLLDHSGVGSFIGVEDMNGDPMTVLRERFTLEINVFNELLKEANDKGKNVVFIAIETLDDEEKIRRFYEDYVEYIETSGATKDVRDRPREIALSNVGYLLGYFGDKIRKRWLSCLPDLSHPIFGRTENVDPELAFKAGQILAEYGAESKEMDDIKQQINSASK